MRRIPTAAFEKPPAPSVLTIDRQSPGPMNPERESGKPPSPASPAGGAFDLAATMRQFESSLLRYAAHLIGPGTEDAQDVVQDTFIRLHHQVSRHGEASVGNLASWLFRVAHNLAMDAGRRRSRQRRLETQIVSDPELNPEVSQVLPAPAEELGHRESCALAVAELERLPEEQRTVLLLKVMQGFTLQQISDITGLKIGTVNYRLTQGLRELAQRLRQAGAV